MRIKNLGCFGNDGFKFLPKEGLNLLVGPNGCGKTTVVKAIDLVLNPENQYKRDVVNEFDFHMCDTAQAIELEVILTDVGGLVPTFPGHIELFDKRDWKDIVEKDDVPEDKQVQVLRICFKAYYNEQDGEIQCEWYLPKLEATERMETDRLSRQSHQTVEYVRITAAISAGALTLGDRSQLAKYLQRGGHPLGKLDDEILGGRSGLGCPLEEWQKCEKSQACGGPDQQKCVGMWISEVTHTARGMIGEKSWDGFKPVLGSRYSDAKSRLRATTLGMMCKRSRGGDGFIPFERLSMGERYALALALSVSGQAPGGGGIIVAEEPETALYPAAIGAVLAHVRRQGKSQVIITSHSETVLRHFDLSDIYYLSRNHTVKGLREVADNTALKHGLVYEFEGLIRPGEASALLSDKILLVEGSGDAKVGGRLDRIAARANARFLSDQGWVVLSGNGAGKTPQYAMLLSDLGHRVVLLFDGDKAGREGADKTKGTYPTFTFSDSTLQEPCLEDALLAGLSPETVTKAVEELRQRSKCTNCPSRQNKRCWSIPRGNPDECTECKFELQRICMREYEEANPAILPPAFAELAQAIDDAPPGLVELQIRDKA